jgi:hypothetical protein
MIVISTIVFHIIEYRSTYNINTGMIHTYPFINKAPTINPATIIVISVITNKQE